MPASKNGEAAISAIRKTTRRRFLQLAGSAAALPAISRFARAQTPQYFSITPGQEFTSNAWCYQRLAPNAPIDPNSANIVQYLRTAVQPSGVLYNNLAMPIWIIQPGVPTVSVKVVAGPGPWTDQLISQFVAVPIPANFFPSGGTDLDAVIYRPSTHQLWEGWQWQKTGAKVRNSTGQLVDEWSIVWGGYEADMRTSDGTWAPQSPSGIKPGLSASGIHQLAFTITLEDLRRQAINHPVALTIPTGSARSDVWNHPPAWRCDGSPPQFDPNAIPEGAIFRLPADLWLNQYPAIAWDGVSVKTHWRIVAEAIQNYGMVIHDQGGGWVMDGENPYVYGPDPINTDPILSQVFGAGHPWGYDNQAISQDVRGFPWDWLQLLRMNLVSS